MSRKYRPDGTYQLTTHVAVVLLVLILFVAVGYFFSLAKPDEHASRLAMSEELQENRARWENRRPATFQYVVDRGCDCPDEVSKAYIVTEESGRRATRFPIPVESSTGVMLDAPPNPVWIDDIFELAEKTLRSGKPIDAYYNHAYGYPERLVLDPDENSIKTSLRFEIRDFENRDRF